MSAMSSPSAPALPRSPPRQRTVGIDLAISAVQAAQVFDDGCPVGKPIRFRLDAAELTRLVAAVKTGTDDMTRITAIMEPTGMSWFPVAAWLQRNGIAVIRVKGQRVKALRKYLSEHAKTDLADAHVLGAMPGFGGRGLDPVHVPSPAQHVLQRLTKQRHRYQELICASRRRLLDLIRWACPALEHALPDTTTHLTLGILDDWFDPNKVACTRRDVLARSLGRHASGNHPKSGGFIATLVEQLKSAAEDTLKLHGEGVDFAGLQFEVSQEVEHVRLWERHVSELERRIEQTYQALHPSDALRSIPGIGPALAPLVLGVLNNVGRFRNEEHIRGFCGMFPSKSSSGGVDKPGQRLTKSGSDRLKRGLYLAADTARKIDPDLAAVYWRLMVRKGHHHKQALCAVATRLVNRIYRVLKTDQPYVLRDQNGTTITVQQGKQIVAEFFTVPLDIRKSRRKQLQPSAA
jgi:transposase